MGVSCCWCRWWCWPRCFLKPGWLIRTGTQHKRLQKLHGTTSLSMKSTSALFILLTLFVRSSLGKLPPTPPPCTTEILQSMMECRNSATVRLLQILPPEPESFLFGMFVGTLLMICDAAEKYSKCMDPIFRNGCQVPQTSPTLVDPPELTGVLKVCRNEQVYEIHSSLTNCVTMYKSNFQRCYQSYHNQPLQPRHQCHKVHRLMDCVSREAKVHCGGGRTAELSVNLVAAGLRESAALCDRSETKPIGYSTMFGATNIQSDERDSRPMTTQQFTIERGRRNREAGNIAPPAKAPAPMLVFSTVLLILVTSVGILT